jgi:hypothetical protein
MKPHALKRPPLYKPAPMRWATVYLPSAKTKGGSLETARAIPGEEQAGSDQLSNSRGDLRDVCEAYARASGLEKKSTGGRDGERKRERVCVCVSLEKEIEFEMETGEKMEIAKRIYLQ